MPRLNKASRGKASSLATLVAEVIQNIQYLDQDLINYFLAHLRNLIARIFEQGDDERGTAQGRRSAASQFRFNSLSRIIKDNNIVAKGLKISTDQFFPQKN